MILTRAEVAALTRYVRFSAQRRELDYMRIGYRVRRDGSPVVLRSAVEGRVESREPQLRIAR